jgi:8-oxo-dGTP diphosphatase
MEKQVKCRDIQGNEILVPVGKLLFRPAAYAIIINDGKVLLSKQWDDYDIPGGAITIGQTIKKCLIREVKEETGIDIAVGRIVACENAFFKLPGGDEQCVHSILMFYLCQKVGGELSTNYLDPYEQKYADMPEWVPLEDVDSLKFFNSADSKAIIKEAEKLRQLMGD